MTETRSSSARPVASPAVPVLLLRALDPAVQGETVRIELGQRVTAGRSRRCTWSLKRTLPYLHDEDGERARIRASLAYLSVSRRHCRITFLAPNMLEIENFATNGTLVDGRRIERIVLEDARSATHAIQLGPEGVVLELAPGSLPV